MLDPLGVDRGGRFGDAARKQEIAHHLMPPLGVGRDRCALVGEEDGTVRQGSNKAVARQALHRLGCGGVADAEGLGQVGQPGLALRRDQVGDQLEIILGGFAAIGAPRLVKTCDLRVDLGQPGGARCHAARMQPAPPLDNVGLRPKVSAMAKLPDHHTGTLGAAHGSIPVTGKGAWRLLAFLGPGYLVSVGYMDPGNWATDLAGGSAYGTTLLSVILLANLMALLLQSLSARLGLATDRDLAQACRATYSRPVNFLLWLACEAAIIACDLAEVIGTPIALKRP